MPLYDQLQLDRDEMRQLGYLVVDQLVEHFNSLADQPVMGVAPRAELEASLREPLPEAPTPFTELLAQLQRDVWPNIGQTQHPRFFAFIPSPSNFVSVLADALAAGYNAFAGNWFEGAGPAQIELVTIDWLRALCKLPETTGGLFVSGGSMANLTALATARRARLNDDTRRAIVYFSDQTHASLLKALGVLGFARAQVRKLPADRAFRLPIARLRQAIATDRAANLRPFCVIANAGTTSTGAVDPLNELADLCAQEGLWLHVDGAYGAAAMMCERGQELLAGIERADSLALDPHKWLFQPFEIGCVLVRDARLLKQTFHSTAEYLQDTERGADEEINYYDYGFQLTRSFRALKLWLSLKTFGAAAFRQAIARGFALAELAEELLRRQPDWEIIAPATMAIVAFRYAPPGATDEQLNELNQQLVHAQMADGFALATSTVLRGQTVLRLCTINPRTTEADIRTTIAWLADLGRQSYQQIKHP